MKPLAKNIGEVIYSLRYFNPSELKESRRETFDIFHDGKIILKGNINKPIFVEEPFWNVDTAVI